MMTKWFENRDLGTVYWLEAPALYILFVIFSYGTWLILKSYGIDQSTLKYIHISIMGIGTMVASTYIWLASKNTSKQLFTLLARFSVLLYIGLFTTILLQGLE